QSANCHPRLEGISSALVEIRPIPDAFGGSTKLMNWSQTSAGGASRFLCITVRFFELLNRLEKLKPGIGAQRVLLLIGPSAAQASKALDGTELASRGAHPAHFPNR